MPVLLGSSKPHTTLDGTGVDDVLIALAPFTTVNGNGGSDNFQVKAAYATVNAGNPGDGASGMTETVALSGPGNTVTGGDANFNISAAGGLNTVSLGDGNNTISLAGAYNQVTVGVGRNSISLGGGSATVLVADQAVATAAASFLNVALAGTNNVVDETAAGSPGHAPDLDPRGTRIVSGGSGGGRFFFTNTVTTLNTGGGYNNVTQIGGSADITPGSDHARVLLLAQPTSSEFGSAVVGSYRVHLAGTGNLVSGFAQDLVVDGGSGSNRFDFTGQAFFDIGKLSGGNPASTYRITTGGAWNSFRLLDVDANTIDASGGGAQVTIADTAALTGFAADTAASAVTLGGANNTLMDGGRGNLTVGGAFSRSTIVLGAGNDTLTTTGSYNKVTAGAGTATITPGSDHATVVLNGTDVDLRLAGTGNAVFLNDGASGTIGGASPGLHLNVGAGVGAVVLDDFLKDPQIVIAFTGGAGGFATTGDVMAALHADGNGGTMLDVGGGSLDFAGVAASSITQGIFVIRP